MPNQLFRYFLHIPPGTCYHFLLPSLALAASHPASVGPRGGQSKVGSGMAAHSGKQNEMD